jgi:hypothetical protein
MPVAMLTFKAFFRCDIFHIDRSNCTLNFFTIIIYQINSLFGWLVADGWCWFVLREEYCWLVAGGWFVLREKYCWLVAVKPSEQAVIDQTVRSTSNHSSDVISSIDFFCMI